MACETELRAGLKGSFELHSIVISGIFQPPAGLVRSPLLDAKFPGLEPQQPQLLLAVRGLRKMHRRRAASRLHPSHHSAVELVNWLEALGANSTRKDPPTCVTRSSGKNA
jgi:hypothetical protein